MILQHTTLVQLLLKLGKFYAYTTILELLDLAYFLP